MFFANNPSKGCSVYHLTREQTVPRPLEDVFAFFDRPENLADITPGWMKFQIITPSPVSMGRGAIVDYLIRLGPLPTRWRSIITTYDPPHCFVDEQLLGPYSFWHHTHEFEATDQGTLVRDHVRYMLPMGPLGDLAHALVVRRMLGGIFGHRVRVIDGMFGTQRSPV